MDAIHPDDRGRVNADIGRSIATGGAIRLPGAARCAGVEMIGKPFTLDALAVKLRLVLEGRQASDRSIPAGL
jgi:hypothetical protein